ncbi:response regulator [Variovorax terrae]|uniref:Response regulator n=1 Tax=Variovorax terrae TaxID=2923278 RepID=A0A9X1W0J2_9BURK|nr:response regulator [Variovorax terrae]MCJ0765467.1 response regulator [Variovorax terrae]
MNTPYPIALLGFSAFERTTFESFFRLAARRQNGYQIVDDAAQAVLLIANADDAAVLQGLLAKPPAQHVLLVGASDGGSGWPRQPRPIKLMSLLTAIDQMLVPRAAAAPSALVPGFADTRPFAPTDRQPPAARPQPDDDGILVVDDSDTALRFMQNSLRRFGFKAEMVHSGEQALERLAARPYRFVFLDVVMTGMDGYQTCRAIKQRSYPDGKPPVVVLLTSRGGAIDKIKGSLAGCDAYLVKPLDESDLVGILSRYDTQIQRGFQHTDLGTSIPNPDALRKPR